MLVVVKKVPNGWSWSCSPVILVLLLVLVLRKMPSPGANEQ